MNADRTRRLGKIRLLGVTVAVSMVVALFAAAPATAVDVTLLTADDFRYGTYIIDTPGTYRLAEDISFNPNSPAVLDAAIAGGELPAPIAAGLGITTPVDAFSAGFPLPTQFAHAPGPAFTPGGLLDARYDPAAYGVGFFAAIAIETDGVVLDLAGHTISQHPEHALLQRFFAIIELADQPFIPSQGPADFGSGITSAKNVVIKNGTIGLSAHHGIHGNGNENITVQNVDFVGYEVGAIALNGVDGLTVTNVTATNRKDVPVLGTFSSGQFIKHYVNDLLRRGSTTTIEVGGEVLDAAAIAADLRSAINNTHHDIIVRPHVVNRRAQIDPVAHPVEYGLFHNADGVIDGNSYSFLLNSLGVAVNGFPFTPDGVDVIPSRNVVFTNVHVVDQVGSINEVVAVDVDGKAAIDPVGAVFQLKNVHPDTGAPVTASSLDDTAAVYTGNPVANAQALVAKANANGEFAASFLDVSRLNISADLVAWVEGAPGATTLADIGASYFCNGDSMFHVNKGVIAFKIDAAENVQLTNTSVSGLRNLGHSGSALCGDYLEGVSHPAATLLGYGGSATRAYTFSGSQNVTVKNAKVRGITAAYGSATGFDVLTDSSGINITAANVNGVTAGMDGDVYAPTAGPHATGYYIGAEAGAVRLQGSCATNLVGSYGAFPVDDHSGAATMRGMCRAATALP